MSLPYFPMFPSDFEAKTSHLTLLEDGAYNRLLRLCWMTPGCSLPADEAWIMRRARARTDEEIAAVRNILDEFFTLENGRFSNAKLTRIHGEANAAHEKRKNAGAKGGKSKALKTNETGPSNATAKPKQPEPEPELKNSGANAPDGGAVEDATDAVWGKCREWLIEAAGIPDKEARPLIGKWLKQADSAQQVREAFVSAFKARTKDPVSYITKTIQPKPSPADENIAFLRAAAGE